MTTLVFVKFCTKERLSTIPNITSLSIGLEPNLRPQDFPLIRIVTNTNERTEFQKQDLTFTVFFGDKLQDKLGVEEIYRQLYIVERQIRSILDMWCDDDGGLCRWLSTESDEDRFDGYKAMACRFRVEGMS